MRDLQQDQKVAGFGQQQSIRDYADIRLMMANLLAGMARRKIELQMHVQIDLCMHMPRTSQTSALQNPLRSAVVFKASLISVCVVNKSLYATLQIVS